MIIPRKLLWFLMSAASAALAGMVTRQVVSGVWRVTTGSELPPEDDDRSSSIGQALAWAAGVGAAAGVARVVSRRSAALVWEKTTGEAPPGDEAKL